MGEFNESRNIDQVKIPVAYEKSGHLINDGVGTAEQAAEWVYLLATAASSHIGGSATYADGAQSLLEG